MNTNYRQKSVKIVDHKPHVKRKCELYGILGRCGIFPRKMHVGKGVFYPIINEEDLEEILKEENVRKAKEKGFEIFTPIEYGAMRTVMVKEVDEMIDDYSNEEIIANIEELNSWAEVTDIYKMPTTSKMVKVQFKNTQMAQKAVTEGMVVLYQKIPPKKIEKEIFVRLIPCNNCFGYEHETKNCDKRKMTLCAFCADEGHRQQQCNATVPKCINCGEDHRTLAAQCPIRKGIIKDKRKIIRDRSKSRGRSATVAGGIAGTSYADIVRTNVQNQNKEVTVDPKNKEELKELTTKILSAIIFSQYMESIEPGSFQSNMNEMYRLNGLRQVNFPTVNVAGMKEIYSNLIKEMKETEKEEGIDDEMEEVDMELEAEATAKRSREISTSPEESTETKKKRERDNQGDQQMTLRISLQMKPPIPPPPRRVTTTTTKGKTGKEKETTDRLERSTDTETEMLRRIQEERAQASVRQRTGSQSSTTSMGSTSSTASRRFQHSTRDMDITISVPETEYNRKLFSKKLTKEEKEEIIKALLNGDAKITWNHPKVTKEHLLYLLQRHTLSADVITFRMVKKDDYLLIRERSTTR